jgi:hypothetical protein
MRYLAALLMLYALNTNEAVMVSKPFDAEHFGAPGSTATDIKEGTCQLDVKFKLRVRMK